MRCPSCGHENVADSRFCGVCGTKLTPAESRVAPTAKIPDDAPFPPHYGAQSPYTPPPSVPPGAYQTGPASLPPRPASIPPQNSYQSGGPASIPPQNNYQSGPASIPPQNNYQSGPASIPPNPYQAPQPASIPPGVYKAEPSMSMPVAAPRRWGLIILVLLLDAGLATAGAILLQRGLQKPEPAVETTPAPAPAKTTAAQAPAQPSPVVAANIAAIAEKVPDSGSAAGSGSSAPKPAPAQVKKPVTKPAPTPQDPYDATANAPKPPVDLGGEIELAAARSKDEFDRCHEDAGHIAGRVDINYRVETDGRVDRVRISFNSTGSQTFASCLQTAISRWAFASRPSQATDFMRPFIY